MAKSQEELDLIADQSAASRAALDVLSGSLSRKTFVPNQVPTAPGVNFNADAVLAPEGFSGREQAVLPETAAPGREGYGILEFMKDSVGSESILFGLLVASDEAGFTADMKWTLPEDGSPGMKDLTEGLPEEHWSVFDKAVSQEHAQYLKFKVLEELDRTNRMVEYGGTTGVFMANLLNPENFLMGMSTGGLAWARTGTRLARALKGAGIAAAENVGVEAALDGVQETRDEWNYLYGAVAGVAMGGTFGAFINKAEPGAGSDPSKVARRDLDLVAQREAVARGLMTEADAQRANLKNLEGDIRAEAVAARRKALASKAEGAPSRYEVGAAERLQATAKSQADAAEAKLSDIEARMKQEDITSMGQKAATSKHISKLRKAAAKLEHDQLAKGTRERLAEKTKEVKQAQSKRAAADELSALDAPDALKDVPAKKLLEFLDTPTAAKRGAELTAQRGRLAKALGIVRNPELAKAAPAGKSAFGPDTASAARVGDENDFTVRDVSPGSSDFDARVEFPKTTSKRTVSIWGKQFELGIPRFDIGSLLRGIDNDQLRGKVGLYVGDPVGAEKGLNPIGASEVASRTYDTAKAKFHTAYEPAFSAWLKEVKGLGGWGAWAGKKSRTNRKEFGDLVDAAGRQPNEDVHPAIRKAANALQALYRQYDEAANLHGVKGFEERHSGPYSPRSYDWKRIYDARKKFGDPHMEEFVVSAIQAAFRKADIELKPEVLIAMGKGMYRTLIGKANDMEPGAFNGIKLGDIEQIKATLVDAKVDPMHIADVLTQLEYKLAPKDGGDTGNVRFAKKRALLDEFHEMTIKDIDGGTHTMTFRDLFMQHDAEQLFDNYARTMSGHIALADVAGVKSRADHEKLLADMADLIDDPKKLERVREITDDAYKLITGQPISNTGAWKNLKRFGRAMRDYNFMRVMNQVGFAQIPDAAAYLTPHYLKYSTKYFPEMVSMMRRMQDGTLDHKLAREMEEWFATGTDYHNNNLFSQFDDEPLSAVSKLEHGLKVGGRITQRISGLQFLTDINQRMMGISASNRIVSNIMGRQKDLSPEKLLNLGLTPEAISRIKAQADKHVEFDPSKAGKLMALQLDKWDDQKALGDFLGAVTREVRRGVQEEDLGDTHLSMHTAWGKALTQFRRFPLVAYSKQLSHGIVHGDAETVAKTMLQVSLGSASYAAQMYIYSLTKPEKEAAEFRAKHLTWKRIFFGGLMRAGMFSLAPQAIFSLGDGLTGNGAFGMDATRTTGLSNGIMGIPVIDLASRAASTAMNVATSVTRGDREFDRREFDTARGMLPFQNAPVVKQMLDGLRLVFPEGDHDSNPDETDWGMED